MSAKNTGAKKKVLILCHDTVGKNMAGPGMRYSHVAAILGKKFDVTLGVMSEANKGADDIVVIDPSTDAFKPFFDSTDYIFAQWLSNPMIEYAKANGKFIIFDLYAPVPIEYLASLEFSNEPVTAQQDEVFRGITDMYSRYLTLGDAFTCSNERQRDFWTGYMTAIGLLKPTNFKDRRLLNNFLICPMGTSVGPIPKKLLLRSSLPGVKKDDFVLVWTGGIYDWYDGRLMVKAMSLVKDKSIKLAFLGNKHPNSIYTKETAETTAARKLAAKLGLTDKTVFFLDDWIPYEERTAYFMDGDAAIYVDKESLETRFSHRTRVLDHIWMELPTICSGGDSLAEIIADKNFGVVVEERTPKHFAEAITSLKSDKARYKGIKQSLREHKAEFAWEKTLQPLVDYISAPRTATTLQAQEEEAVVAQPRLSVKQRIRKSAKILLLGR